MSHFYVDLYRFAAASTDVGVLEWARHLWAMPNRFALLLAALWWPRWLMRRLSATPRARSTRFVEA
jgi:hypothetical protein